MKVRRKITVVVAVFAFVTMIGVASSGNAQSVAQLNTQFSKPEFKNCKMARGRSLTNRELQILLTVGLNELVEIPYLTFRTVEANAEAVMLDSSDYFLTRAGFMTQNYICQLGFSTNDFIRHIYSNGRMLDNSAAVMAGILSHLHVSVKALGYLESPVPDDIIHGQALLRLTGASGLKLTGELDVPTVVAMARSLNQQPQVPKMLTELSSKFLSNYTRDLQQKGLLIVPEGKILGGFLASAPNRAVYPKLAKQELDALKPRLEILAERVGLSPDELL